MCLHPFLQRRLDRDFFFVLKFIMDGEARSTGLLPSETLRHILLRDTLSRAAENEIAFQQVSDNLNTFVEVVHHQGFDGELMQGEAHAQQNDICYLHRTFSRRLVSQQCSSPFGGSHG